ncbi:Ribonuclease 3-like protein 2 [Platanthera zijinensis]|uniref:Ribonuclease 3-like protein 2 n=1 Tax=Platanthera zijinensis TaxID=2320716 RepID=A0AAP0BGY4_9ASPA
MEKMICTGSHGFFDGLEIDFMPLWPPCSPSTSTSAEMFSVDDEMVEALEKVQSILGYPFHNLSLLQQALTHSSYTGGASYERLEFLGDSVLSIVFTNFVYLTNPSSGPGELSSLRAANVNTEKLARVAVRHDFYRYLRRNSHYLDLMVKEFTEAVRKEREEDYAEHSYGGTTVKAPKALADVVESIAGAVYEDCGFDLVKFWKVFRGILEPIITAETPNQQPVTHLFVLCQKQGMTPIFKNWRKDNMNITNVYINGELFGVGSSEQKPIAKLNAARDALQKLCYDEADDMEITPCAITSTQAWEEQSTSRYVNDGLVICKTNAKESVEMDGSKHRLHELCLKKHWPKPVYSVEETRGPKHELKFLCSVTVFANNTRFFAYGDRKSRLKEGHNSAAYKLLCNLEECKQLDLS